MDVRYHEVSKLSRRLFSPFLFLLLDRIASMAFRSGSPVELQKQQVFVARLSRSLVLRQSIGLVPALHLFSDELATCLSAAGVRDEPAGRAALHVRLAAGVLLAQGARLPLPW